MKRNKKNYPVWPYFALTFAWSWLFWIPTALLGLDDHHLITQVGFALGGLGPPIFGAYFTYKNSGKNEFRDYLRRIWDWRNLNLFWWAMALFTVPCLSWVAGEINGLLGGPGFQLDLQVFHFDSPLTLVLMLPVLLCFFLLFGPLPEEIGWRGYALDRLQKNMGPWVASLLLGLLWGLWHLPLFFVGGSYQNTLGFGTVGFWLFLAQVVSVCPLMTWIYNNTGRSILSAILFHFACNMIGTITVHSNRFEAIQVLFCFLWMGTVAVLGKDWSLGYSKAKKA
jgi:membrane protease YdiL (CAAX protease family)